MTEASHQGQHTFSVKGPTVNIIGSAGHKVSVALLNSATNLIPKSRQMLLLLKANGFQFVSYHSGHPNKVWKSPLVVPQYLPLLPEYQSHQMLTKHWSPRIKTAFPSS